MLLYILCIKTTYLIQYSTIYVFYMFYTLQISIFSSFLNYFNKKINLIK